MYLMNINIHQSKTFSSFPLFSPWPSCQDGPIFHSLSSTSSQSAAWAWHDKRAAGPCRASQNLKKNHEEWVNIGD